MKSNILMMHHLDVHTDSPFKNLFPINPTVLAAMTEDMKTHGFDMVHPIVVWGGHNGVVVDGHTRLQAAKDAGVLNVPLVIKEFADEDEAIQYAISSQRNRRNLTDSELLNCIAAIDLRFPRGGSSKTAREVFGNSAQKTASLLGISKTKVEKLRTVNDHASSQIKDAVLKGDLSVNKAYNETMAERRDAKSTSDAADDLENKSFAQEEQLPSIKELRIENIPVIIIDALERTIKQEKKNYPDLHYSEEEIAGIKSAILNGLDRILNDLA